MEFKRNKSSRASLGLGISARIRAYLDEHAYTNIGARRLMKTFTYKFDPETLKIHLTIYNFWGMADMTPLPSYITENLDPRSKFLIGSSSLLIIFKILFVAVIFSCNVFLPKSSEMIEFNNTGGDSFTPLLTSSLVAFSLFSFEFLLHAPSIKLSAIKISTLFFIINIISCW